MTYTDTAAPSTGARGSNVNRILIGVCAAVWLIALGAAVAAIVALTDLGRTRPADSADGATPWLLYTVIGVSAVVIIGAVPLLLRARRTAQAEPEAVVLTRVRPTAADEPPTEKLRIAPVTQQASSRLDPGPQAAEIDRLWLQCALVLGIAMGVAMVAIGAATYLMAVGNDTISWVLYGVAGVVTLAMPLAPWWYLRELRALTEPTA